MWYKLFFFANHVKPLGRSVQKLQGYFIFFSGLFISAKGQDQGKYKVIVSVLIFFLTIIYKEESIFLSYHFDFLQYISFFKINK